jgi:hypothetical protein
MGNPLGFLTSSSQSQSSGIRVAPETALEQQANPMLGRQLTGMENMVNAGPGAQQMTNATQGTQQYADLLGQLGQGQGLMQAQQAGIEGYSALGNQLYGGLMRQQTAQAQQMAARQGRGMNDLMLQNKLGQQRNDLVGSFAVQQSMQAPMQQAQMMGQRSDALQGLASQAMQNRQNLLSMGSTLREQDRSYRINTGERYNTQSQEGSLLDAVGGIAGIAGTAIKGFGQIKEMGRQSEAWDQKSALMDKYKADGNTAGVERLTMGNQGGGGSSDGGMPGYKSTTQQFSPGPQWSPQQGGGQSQMQYAQQINQDDPYMQNIFARNRQQQQGAGGLAGPAPFQMSNYKRGNQ